MVLKLGSVDTNVILRLVLRDDEEKAEKVLELLTRPKTFFFVPDQTIIEAVFILTSKRKYNFSREKAYLGLQKFLSLSRVDYDKRIIDQVFELFLEHPKLSFVDCYLAVKMKDIERVPLWTFDEKLAKQTEVAELVE